MNTFLQGRTLSNVLPASTAENLSHFLQTQSFVNKVILASLRICVPLVIVPLEHCSLWEGIGVNKLLSSEQVLIPATRHITRWEMRAPSRPVQGFQPLLAVSSVPFLARPQHKYVLIWMCHSKLSGLVDTTTCWSSIRDWVNSVLSSCPVVPRWIPAPFGDWCRPLHWAVVVALRQWDSFPSSCSALQSLW